MRRVGHSVPIAGDQWMILETKFSDIEGERGLLEAKRLSGDHTHFRSGGRSVSSANG